MTSKSYRKSNHKHKHKYIMKKMEEAEWFTHKKVCIICGHINNRVRVEEGE